MNRTARALETRSHLVSVVARTRASRERAPLAGLALVILAALGGPAWAEAAGDAHHAGHGDMPMTDEAMEAMAARHWASHPRVGTSTEGAPPAATVTVRNFVFDADGNTGTPIDTIKILVGESVLWQWVTGTHTVTNGEDSFDPEAATLFSQPSDVNHQQFTYTFTSAGLYPYFCLFHEFANMKGYVKVSVQTDVEPTSGGVRAIGFASEPAPNPTGAGVSFRFTLGRPGRARVEVYDGAGRRVATALDRRFEAGTHTTSWDGRTRAGLAGAGVYYLRLRLPDFDGHRRVVVRR